MIELLIQSGCHLYCCGDYDSEGLVIADKLKRRYEESLSLFEYSLFNFHFIKVKQKNISTKRLTILNG